MPLFKRNVYFEPNPVKGISQPLTHTERETLYWFEVHATSCSSCYLPYSVYKDDKALCHEGQRKAERITDMRIRQSRDGYIYRYNAPTFQDCRIEVPIEWVNVRSLLKAMQRSGNTFLDRSYPVTPRTSTRRSYTSRPKSGYGDYKSRDEFYDELPRRGIFSRRIPSYSTRRRRVPTVEDDFWYDYGRSLQYDRYGRSSLSGYYSTGGY